MKRPIFVVGTGRSGSTIFYKLFVKHPHNLSFHRLMLMLLTSPTPHATARVQSRTH